MGQLSYSLEEAETIVGDLGVLVNDASELRQRVESSVSNIKNIDWFVNDINTIYKYLDDFENDPKKMKYDLDAFFSQINSLDSAYADRFNSIGVPNFEFVPIVMPAENFICDDDDKGIGKEEAITEPTTEEATVVEEKEENTSPSATGSDDNKEKPVEAPQEETTTDENVEAGIDSRSVETNPEPNQEEQPKSKNVKEETTEAVSKETTPPTTEAPTTPVSTNIPSTSNQTGTTNNPSGGTTSSSPSSTSSSTSSSSSTSTTEQSTEVVTQPVEVETVPTTEVVVEEDMFSPENAITNSSTEPVIIDNFEDVQDEIQINQPEDNYNETPTIQFETEGENSFTQDAYQTTDNYIEEEQVPISNVESSSQDIQPPVMNSEKVKTGGSNGLGVALGIAGAVAGVAGAVGIAKMNSSDKEKEKKKDNKFIVED